MPEAEVTGTPRRGAIYGPVYLCVLARRRLSSDWCFGFAGTEYFHRLLHPLLLLDQIPHAGLTRDRDTWRRGKRETATQDGVGWWVGEWVGPARA